MFVKQKRTELQCLGYVQGMKSAVIYLARTELKERLENLAVKNDGTLATAKPSKKLQLDGIQISYKANWKSADQIKMVPSTSSKVLQSSTDTDCKSAQQSSL